MGDVNLWLGSVLLDNANFEAENHSYPGGEDVRASEGSQWPADFYVEAAKCEWVCVDRPLLGPLCYCKPIATI